MNRILTIAFGAVVLMLIAAVSLPTHPSGAAFASLSSPAASSSPVATKHHRATSAGSDGATLVLKREGSGQFHLSATVNGNEARFLIDTGADLVALSEAEADRLGIRYDVSAMAPMLQTASGSGNGVHVKLDTLAVGDAEFHDVDAVVVEGLETNLLGQSALRRFGQVSLNGDSMTIRPGSGE